MHERGSTHVWLQSTLQSRVGEKSVANLAVVVLAPMLAKLRTCFDAFFRRQLHGRTDVFIEDAEFCHQLVVRSVDDIPFILRRRPHGSGIAGGCSGHTQPELNATACVAAARRHGILEVGRHGFSKPRGGNVSRGGWTVSRAASCYTHVEAARPRNAFRCVILDNAGGTRTDVTSHPPRPP